MTTIDLTNCQPGTLCRTRDGREVAIVFVDTDVGQVHAGFTDDGSVAMWRLDGGYRQGLGFIKDIVAIVSQPAPVSPQTSEIMKAARLITAVILTERGLSPQQAAEVVRELEAAISTKES